MSWAFSIQTIAQPHLFLKKEFRELLRAFGIASEGFNLKKVFPLLK